MIQLFQGSIFSSKCDLIIIPCNDMGGVSAVIQSHEVLGHNCPAPVPNKGMLILCKDCS